MLDFLAKLQTMDRRWIYLFVAIACTLPFIRPVPTDVYVSPETQAYYDAVEGVKTVNEDIRHDNEKLARLGKPLKREKVVLVDSPWGPGAIGEVRGQTEALFEHLLRNKTPFVVMALDGDPLAPSYTDDIMKKLTAKPEFKNVKYGTDWVNVGISKGGIYAMQVLAKDFKRQFPEDLHKWKTTDYKHLPIMEKLNNINDVALLTCSDYWPKEDYVGFIHEIYNTKLAFGGGGIASTTIYRYLPSGQVAGLLVGTRGGAEYDKLLHPKVEDRVNLGSKLIVPLAYGHLVIILAVVLGNIGYFASQRRRANS